MVDFRRLIDLFADQLDPSPSTQIAHWLLNA
jgi:hypothetical protein